MDLSQITLNLSNGLDKAYALQNQARGFAYKVNGFANQIDNVSKFINKFTNPSVNNPKGSPSGEGKRNRLEAMSKRGDPVLSVDWLGLVMDQGREAINWAYLDTIQTPSITIEPRSVFRGGTMKHYAGPISVDSMNITLYTDSNGDALKLASSWMASVYDNEFGNYKKPSEYKKQIWLYMFDAARQTVCLMKFYGCFPTSWGSYSMEGSGSSPVPTTMTLSVDSVSIDADGSSIAKTTAQAAQALGGNFPIIPMLPRLPDLPQLPNFPNIPKWPF